MDKSIIPVFTGYFVQAKEALKEKYPPVYEKQYYDHVTNHFHPGEVSRTELGAESDIHIIGRLTTDRIDVLLVDVEGTQNEFPHITLSTVEGVLAKESNDELRNNREKIVPLDDYVRVREGAFLKGGGIDYGITFSLNTKHNHIVSGKQINYDEMKEREEITSIEVNHDGIRFMAVGRYYEGNNQYIGHQLKDGDPKSVDYAAYQMSKLVPDNAVLIPVPGHHGTTEQTAILAQAISSYANVPVIDVLRGKERESQYEAKYNGRPLTSEQMGIRKISDIPEGKIPVIVDGVVDTGTTARAAVEALNGKGIVLSFAMSDTLLKLNATEGKLDNGVKIKPSADIANGLKSRTMAMSDAVPDRLTVIPPPSIVSSARLSPHNVVVSLAPTIDDAKLRKKTEITKQKLKKSINKGKIESKNTPMDAVRRLALDIGMYKSFSTQTYYSDVYEGDYRINERTVRIRLSTHPANGKRMTNAPTDDKVSFVIYKNGNHINDGDYIEIIFYPSQTKPVEAANIIRDMVDQLINTAKICDISKKCEVIEYHSDGTSINKTGETVIFDGMSENQHEVNIEEDLENDIDEEEDQTRSRGFHR